MKRFRPRHLLADHRLPHQAWLPAAPGGTMLLPLIRRLLANTANAGAPRSTSRDRIDECSAMLPERFIVETSEPVADERRAVVSR